MPPTNHQQQLAPRATTSHAQTLGSYHVDDTDRQLVAVHVPGEPTVRMLDVLATALPEDHEAHAIADDYAQLAHRKGLIPMRWGWY